MQNTSNSLLKRFAIVVIGRVQGVGFRFFTKETADMYGLSGWVRNCFNGSVEIQAQGKEELMQQFFKELKKGPLFGHVSDIKKREIKTIPKEEEFKIRHS